MEIPDCINTNEVLKRNKQNGSGLAVRYVHDVAKISWDESCGIVRHILDGEKAKHGFDSIIPKLR